MIAPQPVAPPSDLRRALVLGGGGAVGNAWLVGVVSGLLEGGVDVTQADVVVGTSAGATAAAQLAGTPPDQLYAELLVGTAPTRPATAVAGGQSAHLERTGAVIASAADPADMRRRMGALLDADADASTSQRWRATVAARLPGARWPAHRLLLTAVDAATGEPVVLDSRSGLDVVDAVAASTAGGRAYHVGGRSYIDGGYRSNADNADLAAGCARVLVLSPFDGRSRLPAPWGLALHDQVTALRAHGSTVEVVGPDDAARAAFGEDMMDVAARRPAAQAGRAQGRRESARLLSFWTGT